MALVVADRVQETTTTTGTGSYTLAGAKDGFQSFAAVGDGNTTYYACTDGTDYEVGIGTYTASGTTLARTTIIESSNSDAAVSWSAGSKDIFVTLPASKAVVLDASGNATFAGIDVTGNITVSGTVDGVDIGTNIPSSLGTAGQVLTVNAGATAGEWADAAGGGGALELYAENPSSATDPSATGANAIAIGSNAGSTGTNGIAIGTGADVLNSRPDGIAIGTNSGVNGNDGIAIGENALVSGGATAAISIGRASDARGAYSIAIGYTADAGASSTRSTSIGYLAKSSGDDAVALGQSYVDEAGGFAAVIGNNTSSYGSQGANSIAIGLQAKATNTGGVAIGENNIAQGDINAAAIGGKGNTASGYYAIASGGQNNSVTGARSGIVAGSGNTASGSNSVILGGGSNTASGQHCYIFGQNSTASENYTIATGYYAKAAEVGKLARATGRFSADGDAQGGQFILRADTTDATATVLTTNNSTAGTTNQIVAASDTCITFDGTITAMQNGAQAYASWRIEGLLVNDGGTTTLANSATTVISNSSSWGMALSADNTNNALAISCTGEAAHNVRWVANIRTTEVTYA